MNFTSFPLLNLDYGKPKNLVIKGNNLVQASTKVSVAGKSAIVPFKNFRAVFAAFCIAPSSDFCPAWAIALTCSLWAL
ncbi:hypothetical protein BCD64_13710 [Nostoc sp. MBR 210]|nr:hypothetical protein BCD64_13710 [Nostoc sp. MBR 210]